MSTFFLHSCAQHPGKRLSGMALGHVGTVCAIVIGIAVAICASANEAAVMDVAGYAAESRVAYCPSGHFMQMALP